MMAYLDGRVHVHAGDCLDVIRTLADSSIDSCVTDPPYLIEFMGRRWDRAHDGEFLGISPFEAWLAGFIAGEGCFRVQRHKDGKYYACTFSIHLRADDGAVLRALREKIGGRIVEGGERQTPGGGRSAPDIRWLVETRESCWALARILDRAPLFAKKADDYRLWRRALQVWTDTPKGNRWGSARHVSEMEVLHRQLQEVKRYDEAKVALDFDPFMPPMQAFHYLWAKEVFRVLKPGGHLLSFAAPRTYHRMVAGIEDAGFEVRDQIMWVFGSGFPKSHDVSKGIDRAAPRVGMFAAFAAHYADRRMAAGLTHNAICETGKFYAEHNHGGASSNWEKGLNVPTLAQWHILQSLLGLSDKWLPLINRIEAEREIIGRGKACFSKDTAWSNSLASDYDITAPTTDAAREWQGWHTALKPAHEPIVLARKPLGESTVAANVLKHGTGAINVGACRVGTGEGRSGGTDGKQSNGTSALGGSWSGGVTKPTGARWPANLIHDGSNEVVGAFPDSKSCGSPSSARCEGTILGGSRTQGAIYPGENGSAARFFYQVKPDTLDKLVNIARDIHAFSDGDDVTLTVRQGDAEPSRLFYSAKADNGDRLGSKHPTVKPLDLMQYLVRLVTPRGGTCLDPFAGTGTTAEACVREGMNAVLIEREPEYLADIERRMQLVMAGSVSRSHATIKAKGRPEEPLPLFAEARP